MPRHPARRGVCLERGIQADTHAERFLGRKITRAHRGRSLPRALPRRAAPRRSLARSLVPRPVHVRGALQCKRADDDCSRTGPTGVPGRFFALETSRLSRPGLAEQGVTGCPFLFFPPSSFRHSFSSLPLPRDSPPLPSHGTLFSRLCTPHARTKLVRSTRARFESHIIIYTIILRRLSLSLSQTG